MEPSVLIRCSYFCTFSQSVRINGAVPLVVVGGQCHRVVDSLSKTRLERKKF